MGKSVTSTTLTNDIYAFVFSQKGLMAGLGLQGTKITRLNKQQRPLVVLTEAPVALGTRR